MSMVMIWGQSVGEANATLGKDDQSEEYTFEGSMPDEDTFTLTHADLDELAVGSVEWINVHGIYDHELEATELAQVWRDAMEP